MPLFRLDGEVAMITGAGNGIGRIAALTLAEAGAEIAVTDIDGEAATEVATEIREAGGQAGSYTLDVSESHAIIDTVSRIKAELAGISILVNNVGIAEREPTLETTLETWERIIAVNVNAAFLKDPCSGRGVGAKRCPRQCDRADLRQDQAHGKPPGRQGVGCQDRGPHAYGAVR